MRHFFIAFNSGDVGTYQVKPDTDSQMLYLVSGSVEVSSDSHRFVLRSNQMSLLAASTQYCLCPEQPSAWYICSMPFSQITLPDSSVVDDPQGHEIGALFSVMYRLYRQTEIVYSDILYIRFLEVVSELSLAVYTHQVHPEVRRILDIVHRQYNQPDFSLSNAMEGIHLSADYLNKLFKREIGQSPHEYLVGIRMRKACSLLSSQTLGRLNIKEISDQCGFTDPLYFSRMFRKRLGLSPSRYRLLAQKQASAQDSD